jgi:hypothetical protein
MAIFDQVVGRQSDRRFSTLPIPRAMRHQTRGWSVRLHRRRRADRALNPNRQNPPALRRLGDQSGECLRGRARPVRRRAGAGRIVSRTRRRAAWIGPRLGKGRCTEGQVNPAASAKYSPPYPRVGKPSVNQLLAAGTCDELPPELATSRRPPGRRPGRPAGVTWYRCHARVGGGWAEYTDGDAIVRHLGNSGTVGKVPAQRGRVAACGVVGAVGCGCPRSTYCTVSKRLRSSALSRPGRMRRTGSGSY